MIECRQKNVYLEVSMVDVKKYGITPCGAVPNERQLSHFKMGKKAFFHFGVNTFTDNEWGDGSELEKIFNPTALDTDQWIRVIKDAGFKLAIITAKHHDGFCLWPSKYTDHSVKNSPYKNGNGDVIREFTDSCRKYGIKAGVYISPWDRNSPLWGKDDYSDFYAMQLTELMTEYGELHEVWWDGAGSTETRYDWELWESIIRKYQPNAAIFGSLGAAEYVDLRWVGNEAGHAGETHYASIDPEHLLNESPAILNVGQIGARKYIPSETDVSIRPGWFYHASQDDAVKTPSNINKIWFESIGRNSMMLLNFPPDRRGLICDKDAENALISHKCINKMLSTNFVDKATIITPNSPLTPIIIQNETTNVRLKVYQGDEFEIDLPTPEKINVFVVAELIEAGERVTAFKIEGIDENGNESLLYEGRSIGFYKAVQIKEGRYKSFRFTVKETHAQPMLLNFGLHYFEDHVEPATAASDKNIVKSIELINDAKTAVVNFGGIYPFNYIEFSVANNTAYKVYVFNGLSYDLISDGTSNGEIVKIHFKDVIDGSYQIKLEAQNGINNIVVSNK